MSVKHAKKEDKSAQSLPTPLDGVNLLHFEPEAALTDADNRDELERLLVALDYADGFAIFFARCNVPVQRRRLIDEISQRAPSRNLHLLELRFERPVRDLRSHLRHLLSHQHGVASIPGQTTAQTFAPILAEPAPSYRPAPTPVISISGLEYSIPPNQPNAPLLSELNLGRELFRRDAPYPLLIWLPDYAITTIARHAPDFWAWRSSVFIFRSEETTRSDSVQTIARDEAGWVVVQNLSPEEKQRRLRLLESLLDDYAGLPDDPRIRRERADLLASLVPNR